MPYMGELRNEMLDAGLKGTSPTLGSLGYVGLLTANLTVTGLTSTDSKTIKKATAHSLSTNDLVEIKTISGGSGLVKLGYFFYVKELSSTTLSLVQTKGGTSAEEWTSEITALELRRLVEVSGTPYKRETTSWGTTAKALNEDAAQKTIPCAEHTVVDAVGFWSKSKAGESGDTLGMVEKVTQEEVLTSKAYVVSNVKADLLTA